jgi:hypothetical protein
VSAALDALDRGVIEAGLVAAEAVARVAALETRVAELAQRLEQATTAEAIIRRADLPQPLPSRRRTRPSHLRSV